LKELRLEALRDAPAAFAMPLSEALARPDERWQVDAERGTGSRHPTFVTEAGGRLTGMVTAWDMGRDVVELMQMFVRSEQRGSGVGAALVDAVLVHAREHGFGRVELGVAAGNTGAERLYARCGFVRSGERVERPAAGICELRMALTL